MPISTCSFLCEGCVQRFWIGGLFVAIGGLFDFGANGPLNQNEMIQSTTS